MTKRTLKPLKIREKILPIPIIQGGMGVGVSLYPLASAVAKEGGMGVISSAALDCLVSRWLGKPMSSRDAAYSEVSYAKELSKGRDGLIGINIMVAIVRDYEDSVKGALDAGADAIISGAGLPLTLPMIQERKDTALIPIVSSLRALNIICKRWEKNGHRPDAVVLEGPLAGGHLGFDYQDIWKEENRLENLFPPIKEYAMKHGDFPVIVAGGVYSHEDIFDWQEKGADGVQMGTRFLATYESSATDDYKQAVVNAKTDDIQVSDPKFFPPGSPCGLPFRVLTKSPMFQRSHLRQPLCNKGYVLRPSAGGRLYCPAMENCVNNVCICNGLLASAGYEKNEEQLWTVGTNAVQIKEVVSVRILMNELKGLAG